MDERINGYAEKLARMIRKNTVGVSFDPDRARFYEFHDLLRELFPALFAAAEFEDFNGSFLLRWRGKSDKTPVLFMNHHDVVDAPGEWTHGPFSGDIAEGKVWGRGAIDTKGPLCCMLEAADQLVREGFVPEQDIYFESACTEETDSTGAETIARTLCERGVRFAWSLDEGGAICFDPIGGAPAWFAMIAVGEKGCASVRFTARSAGGHAARPGKNTPLVRLGKFMAKAEKARLFSAKCDDTTREMLRRASKKMSGPAGAILGKLPKGALSRLLPHFSDAANAMVRTTLAFTMAGGASEVNVMPEEAWVMANMRFSHHQGREDSLKAVTKLAEKYGLEVTVPDPGVLSGISDFRSPAFHAAEDAVRACFPDAEPLPFVSSTASDNRFMTPVTDNRLGFAPLRISDAQMDSVHGLNENVDVAALGPAVDFYKMMMKAGTKDE